MNARSVSHKALVGHIEFFNTSSSIGIFAHGIAGGVAHGLRPLIEIG